MHPDIELKPITEMSTDFLCFQCGQCIGVISGYISRDEGTKEQAQEVLSRLWLLNKELCNRTGQKTP